MSCLTFFLGEANSLLIVLVICAPNKYKRMDRTAPVVYNDKDIKIRESGITIKAYYFPVGIAKRIPLDKIKGVELVTAKVGRIWGTDDFDYWLPFDSDRIKRDSFIVVDNGSSMKPAFTCTNNQEAFRILKELV